MSQLPRSPARGRRRRRVWPLAVLAVSALTLAGAAGAETVTSKAPVSFPTANPCTGEPLVVTAVAQFVLTGNMSGGGMVRSHIESHLENAKAVTISGVKYVVPNSSTLSSGFDSDGAPAEETFEFDVLFVRQGEDGTVFPDDDFHQHFLVHATFNANGLPTALRLSTDPPTCD
jgi:hypothetical protein